MNIWLYSVWILFAFTPFSIGTFIYIEMKIKYNWFKYEAKSQGAILWLRTGLDPSTNSNIIIRKCEYFPERYGDIYDRIKKYLKIRKISNIYSIFAVVYMLAYYFLVK